MSRTSADARQADVIVVGAGPAGASVAYHLAEAGVDVLVLEKSSFPRDKICGDGLTPRATRQLLAMGIDIEAPGWQKNKGLRIVGAGHRPSRFFCQPGASSCRGRTWPPSRRTGWSAPAPSSTRSSPGTPRRPVPG
jgi:2-polyprenyl-6-methoxyphenol hydroxylase-like FAD-dependent oxidoreductase